MSGSRPSVSVSRYFLANTMPTGQRLHLCDPHRGEARLLWDRPSLEGGFPAPKAWGPNADAECRNELAFEMLLGLGLDPIDAAKVRGLLSHGFLASRPYCWDATGRQILSYIAHLRDCDEPALRLPPCFRDVLPEPLPTGGIV